MKSNPPRRSGAERTIGAAPLVVGFLLLLVGVEVSRCSAGSPGCQLGLRGFYLNNNGAIPVILGVAMMFAGPYVGGWQNSKWFRRRSHRDDREDDRQDQEDEERAAAERAGEG